MIRPFACSAMIVSYKSRRLQCDDYPCVSGWIEKIPRITGHILTWCLIVFMSVNMLVSAAALVRYNHRTAGERSDHVIDQLLDTYFDDARMERIYPNAKTKEEVGTPKEIPVSR